MSDKIRDLRDFLALLSDVKGPSASGNYMARCPAHDDSTPSLTVCEKASSKDGKRRVYFCCQRQCSNDAVMSALGLTARDLILDGTGDTLPNGGKVYKAGGKPTAKKDSLGKLTNVYEYKDADGKVLFEVCRFETTDEDGKRSKTFRQRRYAPNDPKAKGGYLWAVPEEMRASTLYRLPEVLAAIGAGKPVYVVEGEKDADTMARLGYAATTNAGGAGKWQETHTALLKGADVVVLCDNDTKDNKYTGQVHSWGVASRLAEVAKRVRMPMLTDICPELPPKGDITDMLALMGDDAGKRAFDRLVADCPAFDADAPQPWLDPQERVAVLYSKVGGYCLDDCCICQRTDDGNRKLATFAALPTEIVTKDDGVNREKVFVIKGWAQGGRELPQVQVKAAKFKAMDWVLENWDFAANIMPGNLIKDKLRYVITAVGDMSAKHRTVYTHTGWRRIGGKWAYLYSGGAVGAEGVTVALESRLGGYTLAGCADMDEREAARQSLKLRGCMADSVAVPLLGVMFLAPLCEFLRQANYPPSFALFVLGDTGSRKSTAIGLALSYFGAFSSKTLPASFHDTANTIRKKAFLLKDCPIVVDDYHPETSLQERRKMESIAQTLSRAFGDGADRGRLNADLSIQDAMPPRGVAIMSGEDIPNIGSSGTARYYVVNIGRDDVPISDRLTEAQDMAKQGVLQRVMRGYIEWLQPRADKMVNLVEAKWIVLRKQALKQVEGTHARAPETLAHIMLGYSMMQDYLVSVGAMTAEEANIDFMDAWATLVSASREQAKESADDKPSKAFISAISEMLASKRIAVKDLLDKSAAIPMGMVGYVDSSYYYLLPEMANTAVNKLYAEQGMTFPLGKRLLFKQLQADGMVVPANDGKSARGKSIGGKVVRLLWIPRNVLDGESICEVQTTMDGMTEVVDADDPF